MLYVMPYHTDLALGKLLQPYSLNQTTVKIIAMVIIQSFNLVHLVMITMAS